MRDFAGLFGILRDSTNQELLLALSKGAASRSALTKRLGVSTRVVNDKLRRLARANLIVTKGSRDERAVLLHSSVCVRKARSATEFKFTLTDGGCLSIRLQRP